MLYLGLEALFDVSKLEHSRLADKLTYEDKTLLVVGAAVGLADMT